MAQLYGHRPPPALTMNEQQLLGVIGEEYSPASWLAERLPGIKTPSIAVALVRLRNRGLIESRGEGRSTRMWRRVAAASAP